MTDATRPEASCVSEMKDIEEHAAKAADGPAPDVQGLSLSVVIPAYNEEGAIGQTVENVRAALEPLGIPYEIIVVDDGSEDCTLEIARNSGAIVDSNQVNTGYGAALKRGIRRARHEYVAIIDADGTYPAHYLPQMLALCRDQDMVVGDRGSAMRNVPLIRRPAKWFLNRFASFLAERRLNDLNSGLRVFRKSELVPFLPLLPQKFSFTTTITLCMSCNGKRMIYFPIEYGKRVGKSKIRPVDFLNFLILILRMTVLFNPLRVFIPLGLILMGIGMTKLVYDIYMDNLSETTVFAFLSALIIWSLGLIADMISRLHLRP
ncbi:glycosyltransferase involved in cell wall biosynthesis [Albidovulum inexpectatum]|uniref:Glycosyltransferase involved in cell wall biosynthesis n=1 Tax=Albidovulum inexpectatum TaxID=196587 RepID=A0A2S5JDM0_9RHOB|nr:glycosyltransferase family 2 protein [Albidovulum inexpectatum]PPB79510.1 glycosyltransferase involved in cell wall biosynthesis [Albidovulum inexpectatum]